MTTNLSPEIAAFFRDPNASDVVTLVAQQIAAPVVRGQDLTVDEMMMGGGMRVVVFILDRSPSMEPVAAMLVNDFNAELVPAIQAAREDDISALRIGGISFSSDITPIWETQDNGRPCYFHALDKLPALTQREFNTTNGYGTALHRAIPDGTTRGMTFAAAVQAETGIAVDLDVIVLSDGENNEAPYSPKDVKTMIDGSDKTRVRFSYFYFDTSCGSNDEKTTKAKGNAIARSLGIDEENTQVFAAKSGENATERRSRFRRLMRVMSRVSASKGTSAVKAVAAVNSVTNDDLV